MQGTVEIEFVTLLYLLVVVAVPFRPWHVVGMGIGLEALLVAFGVGGVFIPGPAAETVQLSRFALSLAFATVLATFVSAVLYATRLAQHRERQDAQAALRRNRDLLRRTQNVAEIGGWEYDPETDTLRGTEQTTELLDLSDDEAFGLDILVNAFAPEAREKLQASLRRCLEEEEPFDLELRRDAGTEHGRWVRARGEVRSGEESPDAFQVAGTLQDVTEERRMERRLREREEWLRSITENVPDGICRSHPDKGLVYANQAFARMFGYESPDEVRGVAPKTLYANPDAEAEIIQIEEEESNAGGVEVELRRKDGTTFIGLLNRTKVLDEEGNVQYYDAVVTDITDQKEREEARRQRRKRVEALYTATGHLLRAQEEAEVADQIHQMVAEEFGCSFAEVRFAEGGRLVSVRSSGRAEDNFVRPTLKIEGDSLLAEAYRSGGTVSRSDLEEIQMASDYEDVRALALLPLGTHGLVVVSSSEEEIPSFDLRLLEILAIHAASVLDRIERERKLIEAKEEAEEASRLKSALLANMSHEIRTPLTAINGFAEILQEEVEEDPHADLAGRILRSGERLLETLTSLVHLSKLEAGVAEVDREPVRLDRAAEKTVERLRSKAAEMSLTVETQLSDPPIEGHWNEEALNRILTNLLENAIKFTPEGGRIRVRVAESGPEALLVVEDTGIGMSEAFQDVAFDAFKQESEGIDRTYEGAGLGLSVVQRLVQALGGAIDLRSEPDEGTRFTVRLPRPQVSERTHQSAPVPEEPL